MRIVYSYISLKDTTDLFRRMAEVSVASARRTGYEVVLFADVAGCDFFRNRTRCVFDEIRVISLDQFRFLPEYWNFGKLYTYQLQKEPFLHVDFDTVLHDGFRIPESGDIITEMLRDYTMQRAFEKVAVWPTSQLPERLICSGLLGGYNLDVWKELFSQAVCVCGNRKKLDAKNNITSLIGVEEFNLSLLADWYGYDVAELDHNFFTHWQGADKRQYEQAVDMMYKYYFDE